MNASAPLVSGIIPAYNAEKFLSETIASALAQTHPLAELIVVDDGSSDRTAEVAAAFPNTRVIRRPNGGQGAARNTGIQAAAGEWIAFLDHDDAWHPRKTELQLRCAAPDVGVIHGGRFDSITFDCLWNRRAHITPSGTLVRRQMLLEVGGFEESRDVMGVEDMNLWLRVALTPWRFVRSEPNLYTWNPCGQSSNDLRMARAELANTDRIGRLAGRPAAEIERLKRRIRLEYARNLIGGGRMNEARQLLAECAPGAASRWLAFAAACRQRRLARVDVLQWLMAVESRRTS